MGEMGEGVTQSPFSFLGSRSDSVGVHSTGRHVMAACDGGDGRSQISRPPSYVRYSCAVHSYMCKHFISDCRIPSLFSDSKGDKQLSYIHGLRSRLRQQ